MISLISLVLALVVIVTTCYSIIQSVETFISNKAHKRVIEKKPSDRFDEVLIAQLERDNLIGEHITDDIQEELDRLDEEKRKKCIKEKSALVRLGVLSFKEGKSYYENYR